MEFQNNFKTLDWFLRINRSHPDIPRNKKWFRQFMFMHITFTFAFVLLIYSTIYHDIPSGDMNQVCGNAIILMLYIVSSLGYGIMLWHQDSFMFMINAMEKDYLITKNLSDDEIQISMKYIKHGRWVTKLWVVLSCSCALPFPLKSVILMIHSAYIGEFKKYPVYDAHYPPFLENNRENIYIFLFMYVVVLWYCFYAITMFVVLPSLGPIVVLHACGQLELLQKRALALFPDDSFNPEETRKQLRDIIKHSQEIHCFVNHIKASFQLAYEMILKGSTVTIPLLFYKVVQTFRDGIYTQDFMSLFISCIAFCSCPCYYCNMLMEMGWSMREAVYMSGWEKYGDYNIRRSLVIVLIRTMEPCAIKSMFRDVSLDHLADVFQQAYAIFNFLNVVW